MLNCKYILILRALYNNARYYIMHDMELRILKLITQSRSTIFMITLLHMRSPYSALLHDNTHERELRQFMLNC